MSEYPERGEELNERPAIDKQPGLADEDEEQLETGSWSYGKVLDVLTWLLDALDAEGYELVLPDELHAMPIYDQAKELSEEEAARFDAASYEGSVTPEPFGVAENSVAATTAAFANTVFVGDGATAVLEDYVEWRRASDPSYFEGAQFLCSAGLSVSGALQRVSAASKHPLYNGVPTTLESAIAQMGVQDVYLMLGVGDMKNFTAEQYIANLKILLYSIRQSAPDVRFRIQTMPPGVAGRASTPTNSRIFAFNLALAKFCEESDIPLIDVAYPLRNENGDLPEELCSDASTYGTTLNDRGCERWIDYLLTHLPS